jgi:hypothetical protein
VVVEPLTLYRLSDRDLDEIEALLSRRVPRPVPVRPSPQPPQPPQRAA